jgi:hypothetical protein
MLSDMSNRHLSVTQLARCSGLARPDVESFLQMLAERHLLVEREAPAIGSPIPAALAAWLRRARAAGGFFYR